MDAVKSPGQACRMTYLGSITRFPSESGNTNAATFFHVDKKATKLAPLFCEPSDEELWNIVVANEGVEHFSTEGRGVVSKFFLQEVRRYLRYGKDDDYSMDENSIDIQVDKQFTIFKKIYVTEEYSNRSFIDKLKNDEFTHVRASKGWIFINGNEAVRFGGKVMGKRPDLVDEENHALVFRSGITLHTAVIRYVKRKQSEILEAIVDDPGQDRIYIIDWEAIPEATSAPTLVEAIEKMIVTKSPPAAVSCQCAPLYQVAEEMWNNSGRIANPKQKTFDQIMMEQYYKLISTIKIAMLIGKLNKGGDLDDVDRLMVEVLMRKNIDETLKWHRQQKAINHSAWRKKAYLACSCFSLFVPACTSRQARIENAIQVMNNAEPETFLKYLQNMREQFPTLKSNLENKEHPVRSHLSSRI